DMGNNRTAAMRTDHLLTAVPVNIEHQATNAAVELVSYALLLVGEQRVDQLVSVLGRGVGIVRGQVLQFVVFHRPPLFHFIILGCRVLSRVVRPSRIVSPYNVVTP